MTDEPAGQNCENGGFKVETGPDANADGVVDTVASSRFACLPPPPADQLLVVDSVFVGGANSGCLGGFVKVSLGYDLDSDGTLAASEAVSTFFSCNSVPQITAPSLVLDEDCTAELQIPVTFSDVDGSLASTSATIVASGSAFVPTLGADNVLRIPAGAHKSGAVIRVSATDNNGAVTTQNVTVGFVGTGCVLTDAFFGVFPDTCTEINVDPLVGDDRGGPVTTLRHVFYNGDNGLLRADLDLANPQSVAGGNLDTLIADPISGQLFTLWSSSLAFTNLAEVTDQLIGNGSGLVWDELALVDEDTLAIGAKVTLASAIVAAQNDTLFDFGAGDVPVNVRDLVVAARDGHVVIVDRLAVIGDTVEGIRTRTFDAATGALLNQASVDSTDVGDYSTRAWNGQEVAIQHYLLLQNATDGDKLTFRNSNGVWVELDVDTPSAPVVERSTTFATNHDVQNLALDGSGYIAIFHSEGGFISSAAESVTRCLIQFVPNDGSIDDR